MGLWLRNINSKQRRRSKRPEPVYSDPKLDPNQPQDKQPKGSK